jgi:hypothetical protein
MIDQHMAQRMAAFRKVIVERDEKIENLTAAHQARLVELDDLTAGITTKVNGLDDTVRALLADIAGHESEATACTQGYVNAVAKLKEEYDRVCAELVNIRDTELSRLVAAVNLTRESVVITDAALDDARKVLAVETAKRAATEAEYQETCRKLRGGKYGEAKKLLAEMEAKIAKREAELALASLSDAEHLEGPGSSTLAEPTASVQTGSPIMCQSCGQIAKPWVLSQSGAALCLDCAQGR